MLENSTLSVFERREVILDISDLLFQAQENDRPISSVIKNNDIDDFVKKIRLSYGYRHTVVLKEKHALKRIRLKNADIYSSIISKKELFISIARSVAGRLL